MPELRLGGKRTEPTPERRLGIKLAEPAPERRLGGKLNPYIPPGAQYNYKPPSVFARYKVLTGVFLALALSLSCWVFVSRQPRAVPAPHGVAAAPPAPPKTAPQAPQDQPVYIEPLPSR